MFFDDTSGTLHTLAWAGGVESSGPTGGSGFAAPPIALYAPPPLVRYSEPVASHVAASRNAAGAVLTEYSLQALFVGTDGVLYSDSAQAIAQGTWTRTPVTSVPTGANLAIDANSFDLNVVYADADGVVRALLGNPDWDSQNPKSTYTPNWTTAPMALSVGNVMPPGGGTAIGEQGSQLDAFFVDYTGTLQVAWGTSAADSWVPPQPISAAGYAPPGALLATGTQAGTQLDLFVIGSNQELGGYHVANSGGWAPFSIQGGFPAGGAIATIAQGSNQLDLLAIDKNDSLWLFWVDGLGAWSSAQLSSGDAIAGSRVAVASLNGLTYALYVNKVGELVVWDVATGAWTGPNQIASGFAPGAPVAVAVQDQQLDAFVPGADGTMKVLWGTGSLDWAGPASLP